MYALWDGEGDFAAIRGWRGCNFAIVNEYRPSGIVKEGVLHQRWFAGVHRERLVDRIDRELRDNWRGPDAFEQDAVKGGTVIDSSRLILFASGRVYAFLSDYVSTVVLFVISLNSLGLGVFNVD